MTKASLNPVFIPYRIFPPTYFPKVMLWDFSLSRTACWVPATNDQLEVLKALSGNITEFASTALFKCSKLRFFIRTYTTELVGVSLLDSVIRDSVEASPKTRKSP